MLFLCDNSWHRDCRFFWYSRGISEKALILFPMTDKQRFDTMSPLQNLPAVYDLRSTLAHELRTPLTTIVGFAQALLAGPNVEQETREQIDAILQREVRRLNRAVDELLHGSVQQLTHPANALSSQDLASVLALVARFASQRFPAKRFCVSYALTPETTVPAANAGELFSATFYLVTAIAQLTYDHLPITLGLETLSERPVVTVRCRFHACLFDDGPTDDTTGLKPSLTAGPLREEEISQNLARRIQDYYGGTVHTKVLEDGETVFQIEFAEQSGSSVPQQS